eukprot:CAMPEP_0113282240 /NCGR_PEP_ID=MMETSP0008_2-20120614/28748_1 /TAXON_ID=97485 /ORGANISM="Prymnesium parvum" /LENGTH=31 /DNA_ID=CAMNT_0000132749 /DNA_START=313 /DNA_END=404 /DNA_ORIENTATION=- /assembly_acc=CAM_ASM_000153
MPRDGVVPVAQLADVRQHVLDERRQPTRQRR